MNPKDKKQISDALREAMAREELHTGQAAKYLNLNPAYVSMALNEKSWDAMGKTPWLRLEEWHNERQKLSEFVIPDGEAIYVRPPKKQKDEEVKRVLSPDVVNAVNKAIETSHTNEAGRADLYVDDDEFSAMNTLLGKRPAMAPISFDDDGIVNSTVAPDADYWQRAYGSSQETIKSLQEQISRMESAAIYPDAVHPLTGQLRTSIPIDIEINLVINGQRIQL